MSLRVIPITLADAKAFVAAHHRHHRPPVGHILSVAVADETDTVRGVAVAGRPVARMLDDGLTLEVTRVATDGARNACSMLYGAVRRAGSALGYRRFVTYTLPEEGGASLRAAGWRVGLDAAGGGSWSNARRPRVDRHPLQQKIRWEAEPVSL